MSKSTLGLRRAGAAGLTVALTLGVAGLTAGSASAAALGLTAASQPRVTQGAPNQAAGDLNYGFTNVFAPGSSITFSTGADCTTQPGIDAAVQFASAPTVAITRDSSTGTAAIPSFTSAVGSSAGACSTVGVKDTFTVTLTSASSVAGAADQLNLALSQIKYNVGKATPTGPITVTATPAGIAGAPSTASNATVVNRSFLVVPKTSALPNSDGNALGSATLTESTSGVEFKAGTTNPVVLTLDAGSFTAGVTPTIAVPAGYTVTKDPGGTQPGTPTTTATPTYTFYVKAPASAAAGGASVKVSGLKVDVDGVDTIQLSATVNGESAGDAADAINVVDRDRTGGDDRYATAAALFNSRGFNGSAVLSGGEAFPDALSAAYLASQHNTGTLLTRANKLSPEARQTIINRNISTVYITGGTAAVSQGIENELKATRVGDRAFGAFIQVVRLGGANRYATNQKVNRNDIEQSSTAVLAAGTAPYDSLAVGPIVYRNGYPLVLSNGQNLNNGEVTQLNDLGAKNVVIVGGTGVVSPSVEASLKSAGFTVSRIAGSNRYATAAAIATWGTDGIDANNNGNMSDDGVLGQDQGLSNFRTFITNGTGFADALSAGPVAGDNGSPILLARDANTVGAALASYLGDRSVGNGCGINTLHALGLTGATSNSLMANAAAAIGPESNGCALN